MVIANSAALNIEAHVAFDFLRVNAQRSGIGPSHGSFILNFLKRNIHTVLHNGCINVYSHQCAREFPSLHILSSIYCFLFFVYLLFTYFLMMAILSRIPHRWYLIVLFLCMLLIISSVELLLLCLLSIYMSSLEKYLFRSSNQILIGLFVSLVSSFMNCLHILETNPLLVVSFAIIFSHYKGCIYILFIVSFALQKHLSLIRSHLFNFVFISITLGGGSKRILLDLCKKVYCLCFPLVVLKFLALHLSL